MQDRNGKEIETGMVVEISGECGRIKGRMDELLSRATWAAQDAYDKEQTQMAHKDLCSLGYDRLALEE